MKAIVHGCTGKMGTVICSTLEKGASPLTLAAGVSIDVQEEREGWYRTFDKVKEEADVVIDFSFHTATPALLDFCVSRNLPVVVATTGHTEEEKAAIMDASRKIPVFYSGNMSLGIAVLCDLARRAAAAFPDADIEIVEAHHNQKLDVPSGTALMLASAIHEVRPEAWDNIGRHEHGKRTREEIGIHSLRMGGVVGMHEVHVCTPNQTLVLRHEAHSRALFGDGAISAAAWLVGKEPGLYAMADMVR